MWLSFCWCYLKHLESSGFYFDIFLNCPVHVPVDSLLEQFMVKQVLRSLSATIKCFYTTISVTGSWSKIYIYISFRKYCLLLCFMAGCKWRWSQRTKISRSYSVEESIEIFSRSDCPRGAIYHREFRSSKFK